MSVNSMPKENKMGKMPVKKLIFNMALPLIISMLIQALYNIVDSIFVSRISGTMVGHMAYFACFCANSCMQATSASTLSLGRAL